MAALKDVGGLRVCRVFRMKQEENWYKMKIDIKWKLIQNENWYKSFQSFSEQENTTKIFWIEMKRSFQWNKLENMFSTLRIKRINSKFIIKSFKTSFNRISIVFGSFKLIFIWIIWIIWIKRFHLLSNSQKLQQKLWKNK